MARTFFVAFSTVALLFSGRIASAQPYYLGLTAGDCIKCHASEEKVWQGTKHATHAGKIHASDEGKKIAAAVGGGDPRKNPTCTQCHYSLEQTAAGSPSKLPKAGVSCESCHGAASDWVKIHNDLGGEGVKKETETAEHKKKRIADSIKAGMIRPDQPHDVAANCLNCHNLARASLDGATIAKMIEAGHPINPDYELVRYSQGTVRHRFYQNQDKNEEMTQAELARWLISGAAVKLVSAKANEKKSDNAKYQDAQKKHIASATAVLSAVKSVPEAAALIAAPTEANAQKLIAAVASKDVSAEVKDLLPKEYK